MRCWTQLLSTVCCLLSTAAHGGEVRHLLWDSNQRPLYQQCAKDFEAANPGIRIRITQQGWDDYWSTLSLGFIAGTAPDVFTNHLAKTAEFIRNGVLADLAPLMVRDQVRSDIYEPGLMAPWQRDGATYALPADWDTVALIVNLDMARSAGLATDDLRHLNWNPRDGGSFARAVARLSVDETGRRGDDPRFDARRVRVHGYQTPGAGGMFGQTEWSHFAASAGFRFQAQPWDPALRYDDPALVDTLTWLASLSGRGWSATAAAIGKMGADAMFTSRRVAIVPAGSWMVGHFARQTSFAYAWLPLPAGPSGQRASMRNGLAHSLWAGSRNPEEAWRWLRHLGSPACQARVAEAGVVYPAVKGLGEVALAAQRRRGVDASVFLQAAQGWTFPPPIVGNGAEVTDEVSHTMERIFSGRVQAGPALRALAPRVKAVASQP
jgi:multiple sugar transport system substrate-binding protein